MTQIFSIGLLALVAGLSAVGTATARAAPLRAQSSNCYRWPKATVHISGPRTVQNSTDTNYSIVIKNSGCKTLKNLHVKLAPSSIVVSSQPSGLDSGKLALPNLRSGKTRTIKLVVNFPSKDAGNTAGFEVQVFSGRRGVGLATKYVHVN